jgi:hypothetical protein
MNNELIGLLLVIIIYWYFNIRKQEYVTTNLPPEKMSNVSIFDDFN